MARKKEQQETIQEKQEQDQPKLQEEQSEQQGEVTEETPVNTESETEAAVDQSDHEYADPIRAYRNELGYCKTDAERDALKEKYLSKLCESEGENEELDTENLSEQEAQLLIERYAGLEVLNTMEVLAAGRGTSVLRVLREGMNNAFACGGIDFAGHVARTKRNGNDEYENFVHNRRMKALVGPENWSRLIGLARDTQMGNEEALRAGLRGGLERHAL